MNKLIEKMKVYCDGVNKQNKIMHDVLVDFVKMNGNYIDTQNLSDKHDSICAYFFNEETECTQESLVDAVKVENDTLLIQIRDYIPDGENDDNWFAVMGGMILQNATIYNLCESLPQYV